MNKLQRLAKQVSGLLERREVGDVSRVVWKDKAPRELRDWFISVRTGNSFADLDEQYEVLDDLCDIIADWNPKDTNESLEDAIYEHEWADIYNADLIEWLGGDLYRISDVDEALQGGAPGVIEAISMAQSRKREAMALEILSAMQEKVKA